MSLARALRVRVTEIFLVNLKTLRAVKFELRGCPRKNHAKGATAYITDLVHTLHTGITW